MSVAVQWRRAPPAAKAVVVVDIDSESLRVLGPWPWRRKNLARLIDAASQAGASTVVVDMLLADPDTRSPAALARRLGAEIQRPDIGSLAQSLEDDDADLARALATARVGLGFALDSEHAETIPAPQIFVTGDFDRSQFWSTDGALGPTEQLAKAASGFGCIALPGDADGVVRRAPLFVQVSGETRPGLAIEAIRLAYGQPFFRIDGASRVAQFPSLQITTPRDGLLRLVPGHSGVEPQIISAATVLASSQKVAAFRDAIVLIGGSAPELGGLRTTAGDALTPSVMIQAAAIGQLLSGYAPEPPAHAQAMLLMLAVAGAVLGVFVLGRMRPVAGAILTAAIIGCLVVAAVLFAILGVIVDPTLPVILTGASYLATALASFAVQTRREAAIRRRFEQHLAPQVVAMIARDPSVLKLKGERREITALFTDIEAFTAMTRRAEPDQLIALLDRYFEGVSEIIIAHGGMIDKFVGDAVHAYFNAPVDQKEHQIQAVRCAVAIHRWTEDFRSGPAGKSVGFGRTRIGVETGEAILGDVGIRSKLDYTAHGDTINAAARFEAANKELGTCICIGPRAAEACPPGMLRKSGDIVPRGFDVLIPTFEPIQRFEESLAAGARPDRNAS